MTSRSFASPQPRGLPGFLRRTLRNSYEESIADSPSSAPGTPVLPGLFPTFGEDVDDHVEVSQGQEASSGKNESVKDEVPDDFSERPSDEGDAVNNAATAKEMASPIARSGSVGSSKKQLRKVAFPVLPFVSGEAGGEGEESDGSENSGDDGIPFNQNALTSGKNGKQTNDRDATLASKALTSTSAQLPSNTSPSTSNDNPPKS